MEIKRLTVTQKQAARMLGVSAVTVRAWLRSGKLPARRIEGLNGKSARWLIPTANVLALLEPEKPVTAEAAE